MKTPKLLTVSGACYEVAIRSGVEDKAVPEPAGWRKIGTGMQAYWPYSQELLDSLWERIADLYASSQGWSDEDVAKDRATLKAWLDRNRHLVPREWW